MFNSVKAKIYLIAGIPLLVVMFFIFTSISDKYAVMQAMAQLGPTTKLGIYIGDFVHETQKERGATAGLLGGNERFASALAQQRKLTNEKRAELTAYLSSFDKTAYGRNFERLLDTAVSEMNRIDGIRTSVDSRSIAAKEAIGFYTNHNRVMLDVVQGTVRLANHAEISQLRSAYISFMQGKERAGVERAVMSSVFAADQFSDGNFTKFSELVTIQNTYLDVFQSSASVEQLRFFEQQMSDPSVLEVQRMRDIASLKIEGLEKASLLTELNQLLGYGGMIYQFKNYVLRGAPKYAQTFLSQFDEVTKRIDDFESMPSATAQEKAEMAVIRDVVAQYRTALDLVRDMYQSGATSEQVDRAVKIADGPAIASLRALEEGAKLGGFGVDAKHWFDTITTKINKLKAVEDSVANDLSNRGDELSSVAQSGLLMVLVLGAGIMVAILAMVHFTSRGILLALAAAVSVAERIASGDLSGKVVVDRDDELGKLQQAMSLMRDKLVDMFSGISGAANELSNAAEDMATVINQTSAGIQRQQAETEQVATAMNQMAATVDEVAGSASNAAEGAHEADRAAQDGQRVVDETIGVVEHVAASVESNADVVRKVNEDSNKIGVVLDVIRGIAEQTNLLALNAAIEAARAGEHGRGFAVVADEVRTLASRTQESTQEIQSMIEGLQVGAKDAVEAMDKGAAQARDGAAKAAEAREALAAITATVGSINDMNSQIASASEEQSAVAKEIDRSVVNISQIAQETSQGADRLSSASQTLAGLSVNLKRMVSEFKF